MSRMLIGMIAAALTACAPSVEPSAQQEAAGAGVPADPTVRNAVEADRALMGS